MILSRVAYHPNQSADVFVKDIQAQIIYSIVGKKIDIYTVPDDPFALEFEAPPEKVIEIQHKINELLPPIMCQSKRLALNTLLVHHMYLLKNGTSAYSSFKHHK